ncbi:MAG: 3-hexulose-6-phosphate synthase [Christensenellales bacterium]|jgi:3-hexulose-6-phosphate synthase
MLLQLALDKPFGPEMIPQLLEAEPFVDIFEAGTPFLYHSGMAAVRLLREALPNAVLLADLKLADAGKYETDMALDAGANIVTALSVADDRTIRRALDTAHERGARVAVDLLSHPDPVQRALRLEEMGADILCAHTGIDSQAEDGVPFALCRALKNALSRAKLAAAGGIGARTVAELCRIGIDIAIVGSAITSCENIASGARAIRREIDKRRG